ncbi:MAG: hypothetical protein RBT34_00210 [Anaerolineaceae bacterium]|nr:hypothetical protein [Anaerolineaceae bacterium]
MTKHKIVILVQGGVATIDKDNSIVPDDMEIEIRDLDETYCDVCGSQIHYGFNNEPEPCSTCLHESLNKKTE